MNADKLEGLEQSAEESRLPVELLSYRFGRSSQVESKFLEVLVEFARDAVSSHVHQADDKL
jgi:hypothetical protein